MSNSNHVEITDIEEWVNRKYSDHPVIYLPHDCLRVTNSSSTDFVDVYVTGEGEIRLFGEEHGNKIDKTCDATRQDFFSTLPELK
jgi:hypothetical protein